MVLESGTFPSLSFDPSRGHSSAIAVELNKEYGVKVTLKGSFPPSCPLTRRQLVIYIHRNDFNCSAMVLKHSRHIYCKSPRFLTLHMHKSVSSLVIYCCRKEFRVSLIFWTSCGSCHLATLDTKAGRSIICRTPQDLDSKMMELHHPLPRP